MQWVARVLIRYSGNWDPNLNSATGSLSDPRSVSSCLCLNFFPYETTLRDAAHVFLLLHPQGQGPTLYSNSFEHEKRGNKLRALFISSVKRPVQTGNDST